MAEYKHILTIKAIEKKIKKNKLNNLYERINMLFKGYPKMGTPELIDELENILTTQHRRNITHLQSMRKQLPKK